MFDTLTLGPTPVDEKCAELGTDANSTECRVYRRQLLRMYQDEHGGDNLPDGCSLSVKGNTHDFGTYYEVGVRYNNAVPEAINAAFWFESNMPFRWDNEAQKELEEQIPGWTRATPSGVQ